MIRSGASRFVLAIIPSLSFACATEVFLVTEADPCTVESSSECEPDPEPECPTGACLDDPCQPEQSLPDDFLPICGIGPATVCCTELDDPCCYRPYDLCCQNPEDPCCQNPDDPCCQNPEGPCCQDPEGPCCQDPEDPCCQDP
ncbi:MAG: hypothetical protein ACPG4T_16625, partial [Nannocystaceae bacterium]